MRRPLSADERTGLLGIAEEAILARLLREEWPRVRPSALPAGLVEKSGAFVTLTRRDDGSLRGCVGYVDARFPLWETVGRAALAAAFEDDRFGPVTLEEFPGLALEISVLGALRSVKPETVIVGTPGLILRLTGRSGLLLPQVPVEHGWDRQTYLEQTCRKAGLPKDAWTDSSAELRAFTAEVFGRAVGPLAARPPVSG
ncbi:MAG: AmmeMemoRadiSam system protein A [Vicinamibacteria bacterium]